MAVTSAAELERLQWLKLRRLLEYVYARSPYYRRRLDEAGAQPWRLRSLDDFRSAVPLMRKEDVLADQRASPPYGERLCVDRSRLVQVNVTGGTSGAGQEVYGLTAGDVALMSTLYARGCVDAGVRAGDVVALTFPMSLSAAAPWIYGAGTRLHANVLPLGAYDTTTKLRHMRDFGARVLIATPSYLKALQTTAEAELGWDVATELPIEVVLTATEAFSVERARALEQAWGARLYEWYGATQRVIAWTCAHGGVLEDGRKGLLHHFANLMLLETLHPETQRPVGYGEEGEVVVTFLDAEATPLVRFATGDRARLLPGSECACGGFDGYEAGNITRYDDMLKVRGVNFWPAATDEVIFAEPSVASYAGTASSRADGREELLVEVEFRPAAAAEERRAALERLAGALRHAVGLGMTVVEAERPLPRFTDTRSKARRWKDERER